VSGGLGRRPAPDPRDAGFPMRAAIRRAPTRTSYTWAYFRQPLDQGDTGTCVGHAWRHWLETAPIICPRDREPRATTIYLEAALRDPWPDNDAGDLFFGTAVRAGAQALQARGHVGSYVWATDAETVRDFLLTTGPVVFGTDWPEGFDAPDRDGFVRPVGATRGGHAYLCLGYSAKRGAFRCLNSWGDWGPHRGRFWIAGEDVQHLLDTGGEACAAVEQRLVSPPRRGRAPPRPRRPAATHRPSPRTRAGGR
jgi:hypothetical protein